MPNNKNRQWAKVFLAAVMAVGLLLIIFAPTVAHAAASDIRDSLISTGNGPYKASVMTGWRVCLGLADVFVTLILVFLAVVNIAHIQYDTYNLKKTLPWLIIGVILANFSLVICRMFVDAANVLTNTFATSPTGSVVTSILGPLYTNLGLGYLPGATATIAWVGLVGSLGTLSVAMGIVTLILLFLPLIGLLILLFLLYIRIALVLFLAIISPIAFVMLAFPVTQTYFKQWWSWFLKWTFMKPICFFLLWAAVELGKPTGGITMVSFLITLALCYLSLIAPFKLGGAIMAGWGRVGRYITQTNKGGVVTNWAGRRKDKSGAEIRGRFPGLFRGAEKDREELEALNKIADAKVKQKARKSGSVSHLEDMAQGEENKLKKLVNDQMNQVRSGKLKMSLLVRMVARTTELGRAGETLKAAADSALSQKNIEKRTEDETNLAALKLGKENSEVRADLDELAADGDGVTMKELVNGTLQDEQTVDEKTGEKKTKKAAWYEGMNRAAEYRMRAAVAASSGDQEGADTFTNGARELEREYGAYARSHTKTKDGRPINYDAFMDNLYSGRVLSLTTQWNMEDAQIESINTPADKNIASIFEGGNGDRFIQATAQKMQQAMLGKRRGMNVVDLRAWERLMSTLQMQWGRGSTADRATAIGKLIDELAKRKFYGEDSYRGGNRLGEELTKYATVISENPDLSRGVIAEQILASRRRGAKLKGLESFELPTKTAWNKDNVSQVLKEMEAKKELDTQRYLIEHPEILSQIGTAAPGISMQDSISYLNFVTDGANRLKVLGGGGNPINNIVAGKDIGENEWWQPLKVTKKEEIRTIQDEVRKRETEGEEFNSRSRTLTQTNSEDFDSGIENRTLQGEDMLDTMKSYQGAIYSLLHNKLPNILSGIKIGDVPIGDIDFERIGHLIANSGATSLSDLLTKIGQQITGLSITLPPGVTDDAEGLNKYRQDMRDVLTGIQNMTILNSAAEAQQAAKYGPVSSSKSIDELKGELSQLTQALAEFNQTVKNLESTGKSATDFPKSALEKFVTLIAKKSDVIPLRDQALRSDPIQSGDILRKMTQGWLGAILAKENNQDLTEQTILQNILAEQKRQRLSTQNQPPVASEGGAGTPGGGAATGGTAPNQNQTPPTTPAQPGETTQPISNTDQEQ